VKAFFVLNPVEATTEKGDFEWDCQFSFCSLGTSNISPQIQTFTWKFGPLIWPTVSLFSMQGLPGSLHKFNSVD